MSDARLSGGGAGDEALRREPAGGPPPARRAPGDPPVSYELASWGVRAAAFALDLLIPVAIGFAIGIGVYAFEGDGEEAERLGETLALIAGGAFSLLYAPLLMVRRGARNGQTLGKQALGIRVVRESGEPVTLGNALLREIIGRQLLVPFSYGLYAVLDYLWPVWDRSRQCLHDKVAQTRVVRVDVDDRGPAPPRPAARPAPPPPPPGPEDDVPVRDGWLPPQAPR